MAKRKFSVKNLLEGNPLKLVCLAGLILALVISWGLVFFAVLLENNGSANGRTGGNAFARELKEYDLYNVPKRVLEGENPDRIERRLSRLQRQAGGVEDQLSVLKRRRALALLDRRYISAYAKAGREAAKTFAHSAPIAAVAAEAVILDSQPLTGEAISLLKSYSSRISQNRFNLLELGVRVFSGDLENPAGAAALPGLENLLSQDFSAIPDEARNDLLTDEFLLRAVKGDIPGASLRLNSILAGERAQADTGLLRMGAEFFYDHKNPLRAAAVFSNLFTLGQPGGERDIARAADALVLAGEIPGARNIWLALSSPFSAASAERPGAVVRRSLYNLAASSADPAEEASWLEKIFSRGGQGIDDNTGIYGTIRYTRLLDTARGIAVLSEAATYGGGGMKQNPLLDLEHLRRIIETLPPTRAAAEIWLLLGRHSEDEALYEWAAWYFDRKRVYSETAQLLKEAGRKGMAGPWLDLNKSLALLREGKIAEGEKILKEAETHFRDWRIPANLGRIQESRRAISAALGYYEAAAALAADQRYTEKTDAALIQMRLSRCLEALGRTRESRRAIETAFELDPDNINIRREFAREIRLPE